MSYPADGEAYEFDHAPTWDELRKVTENYGDVLRIHMGVLRDTVQAGRLGTNVRADISRRLAGAGLGHLPAELPAYQDNQVVLYKLGTPAADVIAATQGGNLGRAETALRRLNTKGDAEKLAAIAAIINGE